MLSDEIEHRKGVSHEYYPLFILENYNMEFNKFLFIRNLGN